MMKRSSPNKTVTRMTDLLGFVSVVGRKKLEAGKVTSLYLLRFSEARVPVTGSVCRRESGRV